jgi:thiol-disulfide isomerase/thioredoxin
MQGYVFTNLCVLLIVSLDGVVSDTSGVSDSTSHVVAVEYDNFSGFVEKNPVVLLLFYTPWSGKCKDLAPKYRKAASDLVSANLPRPVVLAQYDDSTERQRLLRAGAEDVFNFQSYPALFVFENGKHRRYTGGLEAQEIVSYMSDVSKGLTSEEQAKKSDGVFEKMPDYDQDIVLELDEERFDSAILTDQKACFNL